MALCYCVTSKLLVALPAWLSSEFVYISYNFLPLLFLSVFVGDVTMSIYVGNLAFSATQDQITEVFAEYGSVSRVSLPTDRETGRPRGFAFVEMENEAEEDAAIEALDGAEWMGRDLKVNKARPRESRGGGGGGGGGWNNRR
jgi:RNA recognition motif-containing protein